jgi:glycosyltransferase involved in cell wall biosynthesis
MEKKIAILIPCYNEEKTVSKVVKDFRVQLPDAEIYVYDNNSKDKTFELAKEAGAIVRKEVRQGKGFVIQRMFREIDADWYVLVDGDDTYPAESVRDMLVAIRDGADMVVGDRLSNGTYSQENKRNFHGFGNSLVRILVNIIFKSRLKDIMSGYRVFSRDFVKNYPVLVGGFQLETDMTIFSLDRDFVIREIPIVYRDRPKGSFSKLNTFSDGMKVLLVIFNLFRYYRPFIYFSITSGILIFIGVLVGFPVIVEYIETSYIAKVPSAILAVAFVILGALAFVCGVILDAVKYSNKESFELNMKKFR